MAAPSIDENSPITSFAHAEGTSDEIRALTFHAKWGEQGVGTGATIYYSFPVDGSLYSTKYSELPSEEHDPSEPRPIFISANDAQIEAARSSFDAWSNVANIDFIEVPTESAVAVGDIRIASASFLDGGSAFAQPPRLLEPWSIVSGDVFFDASYFEEGFFDSGATGYHFMLHELGHALGLSHPFDESHHDHKYDTGLYQDDVFIAEQYDHYQYSLMSYSDIAGRSASEWYVNVTYFPTTPMLYDIQAIQYLYGANTHYNTENNKYSFGIDYAYEAIWDAGGNDTIENVGKINSVINLNAGAFSSIGPPVKVHRAIIDPFVQDNIVIAYDVIIENAIGGSGNDIIYGNSVSNSIDGGAGSDTFITALKKSDITSIIQLESGVLLLSSTLEQDILTNIEKVNFADTELYLDELISEAISAPEFVLVQDEVTSSLQANVYEGPVSYLQFEHLGSEQNESLIAADTNDFINLLAGDDAAQGGGGNDVLDGGIGSNFLTGGYGADIFYIDGRSHQTTWSTITDFDGDAITIWGWVEGTSQVVLEETNGAEGYQGHTLHMDLDDNNEIDTSITFTGLAAQAIASREVGSVEGNGYLLITA